MKINRDKFTLNKMLSLLIFSYSILLIAISKNKLSSPTPKVYILFPVLNEYQASTAVVRTESPTFNYQYGGVTQVTSGTSGGWGSVGPTHIVLPGENLWKFFQRHLRQGLLLRDIGCLILPLQFH